MSQDGGNVLFNTVLFTGNANPALGHEIATHLGVELGKAKVGRFSDGEVDIEIHQNVRARDIFVVQPTCAPTNENLMDLDVDFAVRKPADAGLAEFDAEVGRNFLREGRVGVPGE